MLEEVRALPHSIASKPLVLRCPKYLRKIPLCSMCCFALWEIYAQTAWKGSFKAGVLKLFLTAYPLNHQMIDRYSHHGRIEYTVA